MKPKGTDIDCDLEPEGQGGVSVFTVGFSVQAELTQ